MWPRNMMLPLSAAVDTVCSSSLVSTHLACRAMAAGDCDKAVSAGVNLLLVPRTTALCQVQSLRSRQVCKQARNNFLLNLGNSYFTLSIRTQLF